MKKAYMTFPDGGRIYKDAAGHLLAYISVGGRAERKRVKEAGGIPVFDLDMVESLLDWKA